jgi:hypothetical protein
MESSYKGNKNEEISRSERIPSAKNRILDRE